MKYSCSVYYSLVFLTRTNLKKVYGHTLLGGSKLNRNGSTSTWRIAIRSTSHERVARDLFKAKKISKTELDASKGFSRQEWTRRKKTKKFRKTCKSVFEFLSTQLKKEWLQACTPQAQKRQLLDKVALGRLEARHAEEEGSPSLADDWAATNGWEVLTLTEGELNEWKERMKRYDSYRLDEVMPAASEPTNRDIPLLNKAYQSVIANTDVSLTPIMDIVELHRGLLLQLGTPL